MQFSEKIIFLMNLSQVSNTELAHSIGINPSQISHMRRGTRVPSKRTPYFSDMAQFFANKLTEEYQRFALAETLGQEHLKYPTSKEVIPKAIFEWIVMDSVKSGYNVNRLVQSLSHDAQESSHRPRAGNNEEDYSYEGGNPSPKIVEAKLFSDDETLTTRTYIGNAGKRKAVREMLDYALKQKTILRFMVQTDETIEWILEDPEFNTYLNESMNALTELYCTCEKISRPIYNLNYVFDTMSRWLPIYSEGAANEYFYPRIKDGIYERTLFICVGHFALTSISLSSSKEDRVYFLTTDQATVKALEMEFNDYKRKCRPMIDTIEQNKETNNLIYELNENEKIDADSIQLNKGLSEITLPEGTIRKICRSYANPEAAAELYLERVENFKEGLKKNRHYDIISLGDVHTIKNNLARINTYATTNLVDSYYNKKEYIEHLKNIKNYLKEYSNYHVVIKPEDNLPLLYVKQSKSVLINKFDRRSSVFRIVQNDMVNAFYEYLHMYADSAYALSVRKKNVISKINELIDALES